MSVRPLDLQIHLNSLNEISRGEGERIAREIFVRRQNESELLKEASEKKNQVLETPESLVKHDVEKNAAHFGALNQEEVEVQEFLNRHRPNQENEQKETYKGESSELSPEEEKSSAHEGHIDILA